MMIKNEIQSSISYFSPPCRSLAQLLGAFLDLAMLHQWMSIAGRFLDPVFFGVEVKTSKWGFPEIGVPHFIIHRWIFHDKPVIFWGYPHLRKRLNALQQMSSPTNVSFFCVCLASNTFSSIFYFKKPCILPQCCSYGPTFFSWNPKIKTSWLSCHNRILQKNDLANTSKYHVWNSMLISTLDS